MGSSAIECAYCQTYEPVP
ncbi:hypothetical protein E4T66_13440 [Sinimarinibacterium sp. CAU 1509]|nr:hypothetical protein E4T66_13440 [Sinimarinibacterium sp. CAU 1509]